METRYVIKEDVNFTTLVKVTSRLVEDEAKLFTGPADECGFKKRVLEGQKRCFKKAIDGTIVEIDPVSDGDSGLSIKYNNDLFFDIHAGEICKSTGWTHYYFYDENKKSHIDKVVHKILATSNHEKYPEVAELTVEDLLQEQDNLVTV